MKNPFVQMALMMAAMSMAFRENAVRDAGFKMPNFGHSRGEPGTWNPAGSKILRKFYRNKFGSKGTYAEARDWYAGLQ